MDSIKTTLERLTKKMQEKFRETDVSIFLFFYFLFFFKIFLIYREGNEL
jgi:hypothetical protein